MVRENASAQYYYAPLNPAPQRPVNPAAYISDYLTHRRPLQKTALIKKKKVHG